MTPATIVGEERYLTIDRDVTACRRTEQCLERPTGLIMVRYVADASDWELSPNEREAGRLLV